MKDKELLRLVTCVARGVGERTMEVCTGLLENEMSGAGAVVVVGDKPFPETLGDSLRAGIKGGSKWTLCVDADVLPFPGAIAALVAEAEQMDESVVEIQGLVFDRLFGSWRPAGVHIYRTRLLPLALDMLNSVASEIRPEASLLDRLKGEGFSWQQIDLGFGLHDFGQHPRDLFRKAYVHAWKHLHLVPQMIEYWRSRIDEGDFLAALGGLGAGVAHAGDMALDFREKYFSGIGNDMGVAVLPSFSISPDEVLQTAVHERQAIRALGYTRAPVWDWAESRWSSLSSDLRSCMGQAVERGIRACHVRAGNLVSVDTIAAEAAAWGISVVSRRMEFVGESSDPPFPVLRWREGVLQVEAAGRIETIAPLPAAALGGEKGCREAAKQLLARLLSASIRRVLVYGAGEAGSAFASEAHAHGVEILGFMESNAVGAVRERTLTVEQGLARHRGADVVLASFASAHEMSRNLLSSHLSAPGGIWVIR